MTRGRVIFRVKEGKLLRGASAMVSPADRGLLYGDGLYETLRCYRGKPFRSDDHLRRLERGAEVLGLSLGGWTIGDIGGFVKDAVRAAGWQSCRARLTITRGEVKGDWRDPTAVGEPTILIEVNPLQDEREQHAISLATVAIRRDERSPLSNIKSLNYLPSILARAEARTAGADDGLMLNTLGQVAEVSSSNIFALFGDELATPPVSAGVLPGIARLTVLEISSACGLRSAEKPLTTTDLRIADAVFITNSIREIVAVGRIDDHAFPEPGRTIENLHARYRAAAAQV